MSQSPRTVDPKVTPSSSSLPASLYQGPGGWLLSPEGAAVHLATSTAVIADVHLGYEWARAHGGDLLPAHSLAETLDRLASLFFRVQISRLVVAGDLVETPRFCRRTSRDIQALTAWLKEREVALVHLQGNHDRPTRPPLPASMEVAGWTICHGHQKPPGPKVIAGHHHPAIKAEGVTAPCFLVGALQIWLPAFTPNAAGWNVASAGAPPCPFLESGLRAIVATDPDWLDFGPIEGLAKRLSR